MRIYLITEEQIGDLRKGTVHDEERVSEELASQQVPVKEIMGEENNKQELTPITPEDLKKYGIFICLFKAAMTPEKFEKWYAEELARRRERERLKEEEENERRK